MPVLDSACDFIIQGNSWKDVAHGLGGIERSEQKYRTEQREMHFVLY
jgi:hypothetical protein